MQFCLICELFIRHSLFLKKNALKTAFKNIAFQMLLNNFSLYILRVA